MLTLATRPVHVFLQTGSEMYFNPNQCFSTAQFILNPKQECVLITNLMASDVQLNTDDLQAPLQFDHLSRFLMCYKIIVKEPGMALIVGEKTPLSLLLKTRCISAAPFCVTRYQWVKLNAMQNTKKKTSDEPPAQAAKKRCL